MQQKQGNRRVLHEPLERRMLLAADGALVWTGLGDGSNWHDPLNWNAQRIPLLSDAVVIDRKPEAAPDAIHILQPAVAASVVSNAIMEISASLTLAHFSQFQSPVQIWGSLKVLAGGDAVISLVHVTLGQDASLDLADGTLLIDYAGISPMHLLLPHLYNGFNAGGWDGGGISSSTAAAVPGGAIGYAEADELFTSFPREFAGQVIDQTTAILRYTLGGDADLDRTVSLADFNRLASSFGQPPDVETHWSQGNFNFDGATNLSDFNVLALNFGRSIMTSLTSENARTRFASDDQLGDEASLSEVL